MQHSAFPICQESQVWNQVFHAYLFTCNTTSVASLECGPSAEARLVTKQTSHTVPIHEEHYEMLGSTSHTAMAFQTMERLRKGKKKVAGACCEVLQRWGHMRWGIFVLPFIYVHMLMHTGNRRRHRDRKCPIPEKKNTTTDRASSIMVQTTFTSRPTSAVMTKYLRKLLQSYR